MKKSFKVALGAFGVAGAIAVPLAVVACGASVIELTAEDIELLQNTNATSFGSKDLAVSAPLYDLIQGKTIIKKKTDGTTNEIKNYVIFIGTTACPVCNNLLTGQNTRNEYKKAQDINGYTGPFPKGVQKLQSDGKIQQTFLWEDLAGGYGDTDVTGGSNDFFPWSSIRSDDVSAKTFKAVEKYYQISKYRSPLIIAVVNNTPKIVSGLSANPTDQQIYDLLKDNYFEVKAS